MDNITLCFWKNQDAAALIATESTLTITLFSYVTDHFSLLDMKLRLSLSKCQGCLLSNAVNLLSLKHSMFQIGTDFVSEWHKKTTYPLLIAACELNLHGSGQKELPMPVGSTRPDGGFDYNSGYSMHTLYFRRFMICGLVKGTKISIYLFYLPGSCFSFQHIPTTSTFAVGRQGVQVTVFYHAMIVCSYILCPLSEVVFTVLLEPYKDMYGQKVICQEQGPIPITTDHYNTYANLPCSRSFQIEGEQKCIIPSTLRLNTSMDDLDSLLSNNNRQTREFLRTHWISCADFAFPPGGNSYAVVLKPLGMGTLTIAPSGEKCNTKSNTIFIYQIESERFKRHLKAVKYQFLDPPKLHKPIIFRFEWTQTKVYHTMIVLKRENTTYTDVESACGIQVRVNFERYLHRYNPNYNEYDFRYPWNWVRNLSWEDADISCKRKKATLGPEPDYLSTLDFMNRYTTVGGPFNDHLPMFIGAKSSFKV